MPEPSAPEMKEADQRGGFLKFWTTLPGVLTGVAAVIAAVVSLVAVFGSDDSAGTAAAPASAAAPAPPDPTPAGSTVASSGSTGGGAAGGRIAAEGQLELRVDDWADLGAGTVSSGRTVTSEFSLFRADAYFLNAAIAQTFAVPDDGTDREACVRALERRSDRLLPLAGLRAGATVCVLTGDANIAALRLTALPAVGSPRVAFDYTMWAI